MSGILTDSDIAALLAEKKPLPEDARNTLGNPKPLKRRKNRRDAEVTCTTASGRQFKIKVRVTKNQLNPHDFSVMVDCKISGKWRTLLRCNGWHAPHDNTLEKKAKAGIQYVPPRTFHIHPLTERYQLANKPYGYAVPTHEFYSFLSAVDYVCDSYGFYAPKDYVGGERYPLFSK